MGLNISNKVVSKEDIYQMYIKKVAERMKEKSWLRSSDAFLKAHKVNKLKKGHKNKRSILKKASRV